MKYITLIEHRLLLAAFFVIQVSSAVFSKNHLLISGVRRTTLSTCLFLEILPCPSLQNRVKYSCHWVTSLHLQLQSCVFALTI